MIIVSNKLQELSNPCNQFQTVPTIKVTLSLMSIGTINVGVNSSKRKTKEILIGQTIGRSFLWMSAYRIFISRTGNGTEMKLGWMDCFKSKSHRRSTLVPGKDNREGTGPCLLVEEVQRLFNDRGAVDSLLMISNIL